jgi:lysophospholipase L1-like esterase
VSRPVPAALPVCLVLCLLLASACTAGTGSGPPGPSPSRSASTSSSSASPRASSPTSSPEFEKYVALGDSFTAGPLIPTTDVAGGCLRSDHDYPSLLARRLPVGELVDVSCSGATTAALTEPQHPVPDATVPPQLRAVDAGTDLVTLGMGGNDHALFATLVRTCPALAADDPSGAPCARHLTSLHPGLPAIAADITEQLVAAVRAIRERAPAASVVLVGYPRLVPDHGTCRALPLAAGDYATGRRVTRLLNAAVQRAARRTGAAFVDLYAASEGHDICSGDPWVNGSRTRRGRALAFHPFAAGMRATAAAVLAELSEP